MADSTLSAAAITAYKQQQVEQAAAEIAAILQRYNVKLIAQPVLTPDGRLTASTVLVYDEG